MAKKINNKGNTLDTEFLSIPQLKQIIQTAGQIYKGDPFTVNSALSNIVDQPIVPTKKKIIDSLVTYNKRESTLNLQAYNDFMEVYDVLVQKTSDYLCGLLSYDLFYTLDYDYAMPSDYKSKEYQQDVKRRNRMLDGFKYKEEFSRVTKNVLRRGVYFVGMRGTKGSLGDTPLKLNNQEVTYTLQPLPQDRCIIDREYNGIFSFNFDMSYFNQIGANIDSYAPVFKEYLSKVYNVDVQQEYDPTKPLDKRSGVSTTWVGTTPVDGLWCFKWDTSTTSIVPYLSNLIMRCLDNDTIQRLQMDKDMLSAYALVMGDMPLNNKQKGAVQSNAFAINPEVAIDFMKLVKQGLSKNIQAVMMPTENSKLYQYQDYNENMGVNSNKDTAGKAVSASGVLYSTEKSNQAEIQAQITNDYQLISKLYRQYSMFMNYYFKPKFQKYKWSFELMGSTQTFLREQHKKNILETSALGFVPNLSLWSTIVGIEPQQYERALREAKYGELQDTLVSLQSIHTASIVGENGAPKKDDSELADSGEIARDY